MGIATGLRNAELIGDLLLQPQSAESSRTKRGAETTPLRWGLLAPGRESPSQPHTTASSGTAPLCTALRNKVWVFPRLPCHCDEGTRWCGVCCARWWVSGMALCMRRGVHDDNDKRKHDRGQKMLLGASRDMGLCCDSYVSSNGARSTWEDARA